jgi:hypothetical protein
MTGYFFDLFPEEKGQTPSPSAKKVLAIYIVEFSTILGDKTLIGDILLHLRRKN